MSAMFSSSNLKLLNQMNRWKAPKEGSVLGFLKVKASIHFLVLDRGNDQNQTDEKSKDQTEEKHKDRTDEKNKDQTEEINKDQNEEKIKDQTDELDGRDDENRHEEKTEKQKNKAIENTTQ